MINNDNPGLLTRKFYLSAAECNAQQELSLPNLVQKFIDISTEHANLLGVGNPDMPSPDMGWVLSRMTIEMSAYPKVNTDYSISTWVEDWNRHFSRRSYAVSDADGNVIGYANSIWMIINTTDRSNAGLSNLDFKKEWISDRHCPVPAQEKHVKIDTDPHSPVYTFKYCDIDFYRHVNTVRYLVLLLNQFTMQAYDDNIVSRLELSFLHESSYGMDVRVMKQQIDSDRHHYRLYLESASDAMPILYSRLRFSPR